MILNSFIKCDMCYNLINLRIQAGHYDIPFIVNCPDCHAEVSGKILFDQANAKVQIDLSSAQNVETTGVIDDDYYCLELSAEFLTNKVKKRSQVGLLGPFMRSIHLMESFEDRSRFNKLRYFAEFSEKKWNDVKNYYNLFWNNKFNVLNVKLIAIVNLYPHLKLSTVKSEIDAYIVLHQHLLMNTGLSTILPDTALKTYSQIAEKVLINNELMQFVFGYVQKESLDLVNQEKKGIDLINKFKSFYVPIFPVVTHKMTNSISDINLKEYGISTTSYEELKRFYADSFEWILDNIDLVILLNNVHHRGSLHSFIDGKSNIDFKKLSSKFKKIDYLDPSEDFSILLDSLKNKIRNAIQHFDTEIQYNEQKIIFTNTHKDKKTVETMYFIEFADLCIENFYILMYLMETIYLYRKIEILFREQKQPSMCSELL